MIDADGLWLVAQNLSLIKGYKNCVLTPNAVEFDRLVESAISQELLSTDSILRNLKSPAIESRLQALCLSLGGLTVIRKGEQDMICAGGNVYVINATGSLRRCGGQVITMEVEWC